MRGTHTFCIPGCESFVSVSVFRGSCNPYYGICVPHKMRRLWLYLELVSMIPIVLLRFVVPRLLGRVIVAERCLSDFPVWLVLTLRWASVLRNLVSRVVLALSKSLCDYTIYIRADEAYSLGGGGSREESLTPFELRIYDSLARWLGAPRIDTSGKRVEESLCEIMALLG